MKLKLPVYVLMLSCLGEPHLSVNTMFEKKIERLDGTSISANMLSQQIEQICLEQQLVGLAVIVINQNNIVYEDYFGYANLEQQQPVNRQTVFQVASFTKPLLACLCMQLVENNKLDLDKALVSYLEAPLACYPAYEDLAQDPRHQLITARMALSHTTGLPNWRFFRKDKRLVIEQEPGKAFRYSGEGYRLLQFVIEELTQKNLQDLAQDQIFTPLNMTNSSLIWQERFQANHATGYWKDQRPQTFYKFQRPGASGSLCSTAYDYAQFLLGVVKHEILAATSLEQILTPQIKVSSPRLFGQGKRNLTYKNKQQIRWGLGWGLFSSPHGLAFFHLGHDRGWACYHVVFPKKQTAVILLSNSLNFERAALPLCESTISDHYSPFEWFGYFD